MTRKQHCTNQSNRRQIMSFALPLLSSLLMQPPAYAQHSFPHHNPHQFVAVTPYTCDPLDGGEGIVSKWTRNPLSGKVVYEFDGNGERNDPNFVYGCQFGGLTFSGVEGMTDFQSVSYELNPASECNNEIGPNVYINYTPAGERGTSVVVCNALYKTGTTSDGFTVYTIPASAFGILPGDIIHEVAITFWPGSLDDFGPAFMQNIKFNGVPVRRILRTSISCPTFVQVYEALHGYGCP